MDWDKLRVFHAVAEAGSFTHAGETLKLSQSAVSRQISALEESLGTTLFHRHARGLILTEQGELLNQTVKDVFSKLAMTESMLTESKERPKGPLKVTTTVAFGSTWLTPRIREFLELYPEIEMTLLLDDGELDLSMRQADIAIRMAPPRQPDLIQRQLMKVHVHLFSTKAYLDANGTPATEEDIAHHKIIVFGEEVRMLPSSSVNWLLDLCRAHKRMPSHILRLNNVYGIYRAVKSGLGIASLPDYIAREDKDLVRVLPGLDGPSIDAYFVYPEVLRHSKRIAVFRDFLIKRIAESEF
ncbi:MAG TPA: LysR family transcriptional regulator [Alphaproteobacteria bacterium]|nr:LysR family transcriptional regulator [Alphaproteobacteria bacterium]